MKKLICTVLSGLLMTSSIFAAGGVNVIVNNSAIDTEGTIVEGRTLVPVRGVFEQLGYNIEWDANTKTATITNGSNTVEMTQGNSYFTLNDEEITPDVPQQIIDGRFMLPLRAVGEAIGANINWDSATKTAYIQTGGLTIKPVYIPGEE